MSNAILTKTLYSKQYMYALSQKFHKIRAFVWLWGLFVKKYGYIDVLRHSCCLAMEQMLKFTAEQFTYFLIASTLRRRKWGCPRETSTPFFFSLNPIPHSLMCIACLPGYYFSNVTVWNQPPSRDINVLQPLPNCENSGWSNSSKWIIIEFHWAKQKFQNGRFFDIYILCFTS